MLWIGIGLIVLFLAFVAFAMCAIASAADDEIEQWMANHRPDGPR